MLWHLNSAETNEDTRSILKKYVKRVGRASSFSECVVDFFSVLPKIANSNSLSLLRYFDMVHPKFQLTEGEAKTLKIYLKNSLREMNQFKNRLSVVVACKLDFYDSFRISKTFFETWLRCHDRYFFNFYGLYVLKFSQKYPDKYFELFLDFLPSLRDGQQLWNKVSRFWAILWIPPKHLGRLNVASREIVFSLVEESLLLNELRTLHDMLMKLGTFTFNFFELFNIYETQLFVSTLLKRQILAAKLALKQIDSVSDLDKIQPVIIEQAYNAVTLDKKYSKMNSQTHSIILRNTISVLLWTIIKNDFAKALELRGVIEALLRSEYLNDSYSVGLLEWLMCLSHKAGVLDITSIEDLFGQNITKLGMWIRCDLIASQARIQYMTPHKKPMPIATVCCEIYHAYFVMKQSADTCSQIPGVHLFSSFLDYLRLFDRNFGHLELTANSNQKLDMILPLEMVISDLKVFQQIHKSRLQKHCSLFLELYTRLMKSIILVIKGGSCEQERLSVIYTRLLNETEQQFDKISFPQFWQLARILLVDTSGHTIESFTQILTQMIVARSFIIFPIFCLSPDRSRQDSTN